MPIFEYVCEKCAYQFEQLVSGSEQAECPQCRSKMLEKLMSSPRARVADSALPITSRGCPPPEAGPCSPTCCRLPQSP
ncbi:MAG: zinc ribbon domain-containing protein [Planctomycetaceae bacterium]|nr:zinc ribbon domain-containing protein [Planctomycetaceae bacterium]